MRMREERREMGNEGGRIGLGEWGGGMIPYSVLKGRRR